MTTRPRRIGETDLSYEFVDEQEFLERVSRGYFLEWARYHDHLYGSPIPVRNQGRVILFEIELQGARTLVERDPNAFVIALEPPRVEDLAARMRARGDQEEQIASRLGRARQEIVEGRKIATMVVVNEVVNDTVDEIARALATRMSIEGIE